MSRLSIRISELRDKNVSKEVYDMAKKRITNGYNGHIDILVAECQNEIMRDGNETYNCDICGDTYPQEGAIYDCLCEDCQQD